MLKRNPSVADTKSNPDDTADKENTKMLGDNTQAATNEKIQW